MNSLIRHIATRYLLLTGVLWMLSALAGFAQTLSACQQTLKEVYAHYSEAPRKNQGKSSYFDIQINSVFEDTKGMAQQQSNRIQLEMSDNYYYMQNGIVQVLADKQETFTVMSKHKMVYRGKSNPKFKTDSVPVPSFAEWERVVESCEYKNKLKHKTYDTELRLYMKQVEGLNQITEAVIRVDSKRKLLSSLSMKFPEKSRTKQMEVIYLATDFSHKPSYTNKISTYLINPKDGRLLPQYKGYKLIEAKN